MEHLYEYVRGSLRKGEAPPKVTVGDVPSGRGLVLTRDVQPQECVLRIAPALLVSPKTMPRSGALAPRHKAARVPPGATPLSTHQLISLVLAAWRTGGGTRFDVFFSTLPSNFETVPLVWAEQPYDKSCSVLLDALPDSCRAYADDVRKRFAHDWEIVQETLRSSRDACGELWRGIGGSGSPHVTHRDFLWAWLCTNSRCVYQDLGYASHGDNFVMAPLLDMANHTHDASRVYRVRFDARDGLELLAPQGGGKKGDEVCITYGPHGSARLLAEYGFATLPDKNNGDKWVGDPFAGVVVDCAVEERVARSHDWLRSLLEVHGYWGDYTLHPIPPPAHPSHRLHMALRLLCACEDAAPDTQPKRRRIVDDKSEDALVRAWCLVASGVRECISAENEAAVRAAVREIASGAHAALESRLHTLDTHISDAAQLSAALVRAILHDEVLTCLQVMASADVVGSW